MKLLLATFALRNNEKDYNPFFVALRGNVLQWWHFIDQTCVVATHHSADELARLLTPHIDGVKDSLLVVEIEPHEFQGWLPRTAWDWLNQVSESIAPRKSLPPLPRPPKLFGT